MIQHSQTALNEILKSQDTYYQTQSYVQQVEKQNTKVVKIISDTLVFILNSKTVPLVSKLMAIKLYKDIYRTAQFNMILKMNQNIQNYIFSVAKYKTYTKDDNEGQTYFIRKEDRPNNKDTKEKGIAIIRYCLQLINHFADWLPIDPNGQVTSFKKMKNDLLKLGVVFPSSNTYIKKEDKQILMKNLKQKWNDQIQDPINILQQFKPPNILNNLKGGLTQQIYQQQIRQLQKQVNYYKDLASKSKNQNPEQFFSNSQASMQIKRLNNIINTYQMQKQQLKLQLSAAAKIQKDLRKKISQLMRQNSQIELKQIFKRRNNQFFTPIRNYESAQKQQTPRRSLPRTQRIFINNSNQLTLNKRLSDTYKKKIMNNFSHQQMIQFEYLKNEPFLKQNLSNKFTFQFKKAIVDQATPFFRVKQFQLILNSQKNFVSIRCRNLIKRNLEVSFSILPNAFIKLPSQVSVSQTKVNIDEQKILLSLNIFIQNFSFRYLEGVIVCNDRRFQIPIPVTLLNFISFDSIRQQNQVLSRYVTTLHSSEFTSSSETDILLKKCFQKSIHLKTTNLCIRMHNDKNISVIMRLQGNDKIRLISLVFDSTNDRNRLFCINLIKLFEFLFI